MMGGRIDGTEAIKTSTSEKGPAKTVKDLAKLLSEVLQLRAQLQRAETGRRLH